MILHSKDGLRGTFRRADNGQPVRWVRWYDTETHLWEAFRCDPAVAQMRGIPLRSLLYQGQCELIFTPTAPTPTKPAGRVAPSTPLEEIRREILKGGEIKVKPLVWLAGMKPPECDEPKCHRAAEYSVALERLVEPERGINGLLFERAVTIGAWSFCSWHYRPPRQISERGVETELENIGARPQ